MIYKVKATIREGQHAEFYKKLTDGTIRAQKPDGEEIVESMERARVTSPGVIEWSEMCFCSTPLRHERQTVYDHFLTDLETQPIKDYIQFEGEPFMEYLARVAGASARE